MKYSEPKRFNGLDDTLYNFADIAKKTKIQQCEIMHLSNLENCPYPITVDINSFDDLVLVVEQDYHLNKVVYVKFPVIHADQDIFHYASRLVSIYLSGRHIHTQEAMEYRNRVLKHLHHI